VFCGFRPLNVCDFASQNQPQFHNERKLSLYAKATVIYMSKKKNKINFKRTWQNNLYMLKMITKSAPGILVMSVIVTLLGAVNSFLLNAYMYQYALNALQEGKQIKSIILTLALMLIYSCVYVVVRNISSAYIELRTPKVEAHIQNLLHKKASEVELACFENSDFYDNYVKASGEASKRAFAVMNNLCDFIWIAVNVSAVGSLIITIDPIFLLLAFVPLTFTLLLGKRQNRIKHEYSMRQKEINRQKDYVRRTFYLTDYAKEMRLTEMWRVMEKRMADSVAELKKINDQYGYKIMWFRYLFDLLFDAVVYSGTIVLAVFKTFFRNMLVGDCFVVINSINNISGNLNYVGNVFMKLDENSLYIDNLRAFLDYESKIPENENAPLAPSVETLELSNVSFAYEGQKTPALSNINMSIKKGEKIAIVGHNGAGKSTLIKLLLRLYDPTDGNILINGESIKNYRLSSYRDLFGTVFQDYRLFSASIAENVMLRGDLTSEDREKVSDALKNSGISDKISTLPNGIDTTVTKEFDKNGAVFSGGEAQKISIARVFAGENEIVIMDEPTSALDPIAEQEMYQNMFSACEGKTVIFISHRLSSATMADRVYLFENGSIAEEGSHRELLLMDGKYANMWHKQADNYADSKTEVTA